MIKTISLALSILVLHLILVYSAILPGKLEIMSYIDLTIAIIFVSGFAIAFTGVKLGAENFNLRFLLTTTLQMLLMLGLILILTFKKIGDTRVVGFTAISLFIILLAIQSVALIRAVNKK
ncbi:MAG: hypothetical protein V4622_04855 [Bacteroidota bacterium]